jgi:hypothetical protein
MVSVEPEPIMEIRDDGQNRIPAVLYKPSVINGLVSPVGAGVLHQRASRIRGTVGVAMEFAAVFPPD